MKFASLFASPPRIPLFPPPLTQTRPPSLLFYSQRDASGDTPLHLAAERGHLEIFREVLRPHKSTMRDGFMLPGAEPHEGEEEVGISSHGRNARGVGGGVGGSSSGGGRRWHRRASQGGDGHPFSFFPGIIKVTGDWLLTGC